MLNKSLQKRVVNIDMFNTHVAHAQFTINHRPLSYATQNDGDLPLTPDMLLHGRNFNITNLPVESDMDDLDFQLIDREVIANSFKKLNNTLISFDNLWSSHYVDAI